MGFSKLRISLFLGIIFLVISCKQTKNIVREEVANAKLENALLWEISGKNLSKNSYLFGTIHIISADDYFLPKGMLTAIDNVDKIVFEINMEEMKELEEMKDIPKVMGLIFSFMMKDNISIKDLVTDDDYKLIKDHFDDLGLPFFLFEKIKPMFLTVFSSGDIKPGDIQSGLIKSYENELLNIGKEANKEFGGLETIEYQISLFDSIPYEDQAKMLVESIKATNTEREEFKEMIRIYKEQDLNAMQDLFASEEGGLEGHEDVLLVNRNKNWIPVMEEEMSLKAIFFAVGAGHLGGKYGVIRLLREAGYKLKPISNTQ